MSRKKIIGEWSVTALLIGIVLLLAVPLLLGAAYTYPAADDFIFESGSAEWARMNGSFFGHFLAAWNYYMTWEGRYISNLFLFTILPFTRLGLNGFRIIMVMLSLFFELSLYFMVSGMVRFSSSPEVVENSNRERNKKLFLYGVLLFATLGLPGTWIGKEIFYWYTGAIGYLIGVNILFLSLGCFFLANCRKKRRGYDICSALFGFMAAGTCPQVASFVCSWLLIALLAVTLSAPSNRRQFTFWNIFPFCASFLGAVINVAAPGSLSRSRLTMEEEGIHYGLADAVKDTFVCQKEELGQILRDPVFIALVITVVLVFVCCQEKMRKGGKRVNGIGALIMAVSVLLSQYLCIFPVVLGYHGGGLYNDRTKYVADFEIRFSLIFAVIYVAQYLSQIVSEHGIYNRTFCLASILCGVFLCIAGFAFLYNSGDECDYGYSFELIRELRDGTVQEVFSLRKEVLEALENAEDGTDVYLRMPPLPDTRVTYSQGIVDDPGVQTNQAVATMFHLNTVAVQYGGQ